MLETISTCHLRNYSIFINGTDLFACYEYVGSDNEAEMARMAANPVTQEWWQHTKPCIAWQAE